MKFKFYHIDVFTEIKFGGNPLAVFIKTEELTSKTMQLIAKEMNLSETVFIDSSECQFADFSIRIFTPEKELPFAGHPTLGTAHILREIGKVPSGNYQINLSMEAGIITVEEKNKENLLFMAQPLPDFQKPLHYHNEISNYLNVPTSSISISSSPIQIASNGLSILIVPIISLKLLEKIKINITELKEFLDSIGAEIIYIFTRESNSSEPVIHARAFAPSLGIHEDPATGSAAGVLGAYLCNHNLLTTKECKSFTIKQGYQINRPALIHVEIEKKDNKIKSLMVGGKSITIMEGYIEI